MAENHLVPTPHGEARVVGQRSPEPRLALVLQPGASGAVNSRDLLALAASLPARGVSTYVVQPAFSVAGGRLAGRPTHLDDDLVAVVAHLRLDVPLVVGGRSAGARSSCRSAGAVGAAGCVALAFPLHPPGRPERSRLEELLDCATPTLVVQGERDPFGGPGEYPADLLARLPEGSALVGVPDADHGFRVPRASRLTQAETLALVVDTVAVWLDGNQG